MYTAGIGGCRLTSVGLSHLRWTRPVSFRSQRYKQSTVLFLKLVVWLRKHEMSRALFHCYYLTVSSEFKKYFGVVRKEAGHTRSCDEEPAWTYGICKSEVWTAESND